MRPWPFAFQGFHAPMTLYAFFLDAIEEIYNNKIINLGGKSRRYIGEIGAVACNARAILAQEYNLLCGLVNAISFTKSLYRDGVDY